MTYQTITYSLAAGVATIALNRPEVMNALSRQMRAELLHAVTRSATEAMAARFVRGRIWAMHRLSARWIWRPS